MSQDRIVAVGLLTERDLDVLGTGFRRLFPVNDDSQFADLLRALDQVEAGPQSGASGDVAGTLGRARDRSRD